MEWRSSGPTDYCADLSVALHYYNAQDKWNDDHSLLGLGFETLLAAPTQEAAARWPRQCSAIRTCLDRLARYEAEGSEDLDAVSGCFGELMAELFDYRQDHWSPELRSIGFNLASTSTCWMPTTTCPGTSARRIQSPAHPEQRARVRGRDAGDL